MNRKEMNRITLNIFQSILEDRIKHKQARLVSLLKDEMKGGKYLLTCVIEMKHMGEKKKKRKGV